MEQAGVVADVVVYSGLLDACAKAGDLARAKEVFARTGFHWSGYFLGLNLPDT